MPRSRISSRRSPPHERQVVVRLIAAVPDDSKKSRYHAIVRARPSSSANWRRPAELLPGRRGATGTGGRSRCWPRCGRRVRAFEPMSCRDAIDELAHRHLDLVREVERAPLEARVAPPASRPAACRRWRRPRRRSSRGSNVPSDRMTGRSTADDRPDRPGDDPVPVQIAAAEEVAAAGDDDRRSVGRRRRPARSGRRTTC